jgi:hypothetical protein
VLLRVASVHRHPFLVLAFRLIQGSRMIFEDNFDRMIRNWCASIRMTLP